MTGLLAACGLLLGTGPDLVDKTLVVWVAPAEQQRGGGSALTIDDGRDRFGGKAIAGGKQSEGRSAIGAPIQAAPAQGVISRAVLITAAAINRADEDDRAGGGHDGLNALVAEDIGTQERPGVAAVGRAQQPQGVAAIEAVGVANKTDISPDLQSVIRPLADNTWFTSIELKVRSHFPPFSFCLFFIIILECFCERFVDLGRYSAPN